MQVNEAVRTRRSVKWYDAEHQMPEQTFSTLMQHAILAPTAFNIQNWRFVRVTDPEQRKAIRAVAWDQAQVEDASELLVLCFDRKAWERNPARYWRLAPQEVQDFLVPAIDDYYRGRPQVEQRAAGAGRGEEGSGHGPGSGGRDGADGSRFRR